VTLISNHSDAVLRAAGARDLTSAMFYTVCQKRDSCNLEYLIQL